MIVKTKHQNDTDAVWNSLVNEARTAASDEPILSDLLHACIIDRDSLEEALSYRLARKLGHHAVSEQYLQDTFMEALSSYPRIGVEVRRDIAAVKERDPACEDYLTPVLYYKGFHALTCYRAAHYLWGKGRRFLAYYLQSIVSEVFQVDIHPAAKIGSGIMIDHATGVVVGETAVIDNDVSMLHGVTLGGTGKEHGDRHPKVRSGVLIAAGSKILGNVEIGEGAWIGAGSVVLTDIPAHTTAVGVPAKVVGKAGRPTPAFDMDQKLC